MVATIRGMACLVLANLHLALWFPCCRRGCSSFHFWGPSETESFGSPLDDGEVGAGGCTDARGRLRVSTEIGPGVLVEVIVVCPDAHRIIGVSMEGPREWMASDGQVLTFARAAIAPILACSHDLVWGLCIQGRGHGSDR